ncbi:MAG: ATP-binding cassette domain-containing protein [Oscillospiraceae bacterium]|jgi:ABC-2 type transport system ATP-binding protein|nr:ATP-binding cassette domain-containing protein [Oscillospiraceae bacterium]
MFAIRTQNLSKHYRGSAVVDSVNLCVQKGESYGLVGANGAGKTTLMKLIVGLAEASSGSVELFGSTDGRQRNKIGCLIEIPGLFIDMTAEQHLDTTLALLPPNPRFGIREVLAMVGLEDTRKKPVKKFSLGMKQRLGIATALLGSPELLILDEPVNGLDPIGIREMSELFVRLRQEYGMTMLISSHLLTELAKVVSCYGVVANGKLLAELRQEELQQLSVTADGVEDHIITLMEGN